MLFLGEREKRILNQIQVLTLHFILLSAFNLYFLHICSTETYC